MGDIRHTRTRKAPAERISPIKKVYQLDMFGDPVPVPDEDPQPYQGRTLSVRAVNHRDGSRSYGLYRPWSAERSIIDSYDSMAQANHIAQAIDEMGGNFYAANRRKARESWKESQE